MPFTKIDAAWLHEQERLRVLRSTRLLNSDSNAGFDRITRLACALFDVPAAMVSLVDTDWLWFKSKVGLDAEKICREESFCDYTIRDRLPLVVEDATKDARFSRSALVTPDTGIRFYVGAPLILGDGYAIGSLCLVDYRPRTFSLAQRQQLEELAQLIVAQIELQGSLGRLDGITRLPNRSQLGEDLQDLYHLHGEQTRTLCVLEVLDHGTLQTTIRALGLSPLELFLKDLAKLLLDVESRYRLRVYYIGIARFALLLQPNIDSQDAAISELMALLKRPILSGGIPVELQLNAGAVTFTLEPDAIADALRKATVAVYQARAEQRPLVLYDIASDARHRRSYSLLQDIPRAMAAGEFHLVYQPKFHVDAFAYESVEALLRWTHPVHGAIPPGEFIPLVENTTLIHLITEWVLHTALAQLAEWQTQGLDLAIAINVSARNLEHPDFLKVIRNACSLHSIRLNLLQIECTENAALTGQATLQTLQEIRSMGVRVSLDDFGIGYCNLACLHSLPAELLKLDRSLVAPIVSDMRARALLQSIITLGRAMGYRLLAEGVEDAQVFDLLFSMGCDEMQGYYLCRPIPANAVVAFTQKWVNAGDENFSVPCVAISEIAL